MESKPLKKQPKQKRSQDVVDAILEAATRILSEKTLQSTTTNRIADTAGVGIGSVYDYFPDKKSIAIALIDRRLEKTLNALEELLNQPQLTLPELIDQSFEFIDDHFWSKRAFLRQIFILAPESGRMDSLFQHRFQATLLLQKTLVEKYQKDPVWAEQKAFILMNSVMGVLDGSIITEHFPFESESLKKDLKQMVRAILES